jgi:hypothetical protein
MRSTITLSYTQKSAPKRLFIQPVCFRAFGWTGAGSHLVLKKADTFWSEPGRVIGDIAYH